MADALIENPDNGEEHQYHPDFIAVLDDGHGLLDLLNLIVEMTGEKKKRKAAKVMTARTPWVPAVNDHGAFGRWGFIEIGDRWDAESTIRGSIRKCASTEKEEKRAEG
jgi:type III restriction enzyme